MWLSGDGDAKRTIDNRTKCRGGEWNKGVWHHYGFAHLYPQVLDDDVAYAAAGGGRGGGACPVIVVVFVGRDDPMPFVGRHRRPAAQPTAVRRRRSAVARFQGHGHNGRRATRRRVTARRTVARTRKLWTHWRDDDDGGVTDYTKYDVRILSCCCFSDGSFCGRIEYGRQRRAK